MELCLMGAVHRDPDGKKTLETVLEHLDPAAISLEVSPESIRLRYLLSRRWIKVFRERIAELARQTGTTPGRIAWPGPDREAFMNTYASPMNFGRPWTSPAAATVPCF